MRSVHMNHEVLRSLFLILGAKNQEKCVCLIYVSIGSIRFYVLLEVKFTLMHYPERQVLSWPGLL